jgi:hypothetical protein
VFDVRCVAWVTAHQLLQQLAASITSQQLSTAEGSPLSAAVGRSGFRQLQEPATVLADVNIVTAHCVDFRRRVLTSCDKNTKFCFHKN